MRGHMWPFNLLEFHDFLHVKEQKWISYLLYLSFCLLVPYYQILYQMLCSKKLRDRVILQLSILSDGLTCDGVYHWHTEMFGIQHLVKNLAIWHKATNRWVQKVQIPFLSFHTAKFVKFQWTVVMDYCPQKADPNRVRITTGGNLINYPDQLTTRTANLMTSTLLWNSVIST